MAGDETVGVLEAERRRQQRWRDLGLPDPVAVRSYEAFVRQLYAPDWVHPLREVLDAYFDEHPDERPSNW